MSNNDILRARYNQLDNYCKRLAHIGDDGSGIFLLEKILDNERASNLKTIRHFKNNSISHSNTFASPEAPYEYIEFIEDLLSYVEENENYVRDKFSQINRNNHNNNYKKPYTPNNSNNHTSAYERKDPFSNYPDPEPGTKKEWFTYAKNDVWYDPDVYGTSFVREMFIDICETILKYEKLDASFDGEYKFRGLDDIDDDDVIWDSGKMPLPINTRVYIVAKRIGYDEAAIFLFNTKGSLYGSVILVTGSNKEEYGYHPAKTYGHYYFYGDESDSHGTKIKKVLQGYNVHYSDSDLRK